MRHAKSRLAVARGIGEHAWLSGTFVELIHAAGSELCKPALEALDAALDAAIEPLATAAKQPDEWMFDADLVRQVEAAKQWARPLAQLLGATSHDASSAPSATVAMTWRVKGGASSTGHSRLQERLRDPRRFAACLGDPQLLPLLVRVWARAEWLLLADEVISGGGDPSTLRMKAMHQPDFALTFAASASFAFAARAPPPPAAAGSAASAAPPTDRRERRARRDVALTFAVHFLRLGGAPACDLLKSPTLLEEIEALWLRAMIEPKVPADLTTLTHKLIEMARAPSHADAGSPDAVARPTDKALRERSCVVDSLVHVSTEMAAEGTAISLDTPSFGRVREELLTRLLKRLALVHVPNAQSTTQTCRQRLEKVFKLMGQRLPHLVEEEIDGHASNGPPPPRAPQHGLQSRQPSAQPRTASNPSAQAQLQSAAADAYVAFAARLARTLVVHLPHVLLANSSVLFSTMCDLLTANGASRPGVTPKVSRACAAHGREMLPEIISGLLAVSQDASVKRRVDDLCSSYLMAEIAQSQSQSQSQSQKDDANKDLTMMVDVLAACDNAVDSSGGGGSGGGGGMSRCGLRARVMRKLLLPRILLPPPGSGGERRTACLIAITTISRINQVCMRLVDLGTNEKGQKAAQRRYLEAPDVVWILEVALPALALGGLRVAGDKMCNGQLGHECALAEKLWVTTKFLLKLRCRSADERTSASTVITVLLSQGERGTRRACALLWALGSAFLQRTHGALATEAHAANQHSLWKRVYSEELKLDGCAAYALARTRPMRPRASPSARARPHGPRHRHPASAPLSSHSVRCACSALQGHTQARSLARSELRVERPIREQPRQRAHSM